jgi:hypothetical protein
MGTDLGASANERHHTGASRMTRFETQDRLASVIFRKLPGTTSRQAQGSHRLAKEIAVTVMDELERITRMEGNT